MNKWTIKRANEQIWKGKKMTKGEEEQYTSTIHGQESLTLKRIKISIVE